MQMQLKSGVSVDEYTLLHNLGQGGMSEVFLGREQVTGKLVVLKFPNSAILEDPMTYERFRREVEIGTTLTHPNIQKLYKLAGSKFSPYLVLEYVEGETLREHLNIAETLTTEEQAIALGIQLARTLEYIHNNHIYHRDFKPENIIITPEGEAKIMDFGVALIEGARRVTWGRAFSLQIGTPKYMSPEQAIGKRGDARSDIYALGTVMFEMLAGRTPFKSNNPDNPNRPMEVMNQHLIAKLPLIRDFNPTVNPALEEIVLKALRRDPEKRWQTMTQFAEALEKPQSVALPVLCSEREAEQDKAVNKMFVVSPNNELGIPLWQVGLIIAAIFLILIALIVLVQLLHH